MEAKLEDGFINLSSIGGPVAVQIDIRVKGNDETFLVFAKGIKEG